MPPAAMRTRILYCPSWAPFSSGGLVFSDCSIKLLPSCSCAARSDSTSRRRSRSVHAWSRYAPRSSGLRSSALASTFFTSCQRSALISSARSGRSGLTSFSRWHEALQLFGPVQHDVDLRRRGLVFYDWLEHQEPLAIRGDVVVRPREPTLSGLVVPFEELARFRRREVRLRANVRGHHRVSDAIEKLPPVAIPNRLGPAIGRDLPLAA